MSNILDLEGRVALVTGAGQGVGRAIAMMLAENGAKAIVVNDYFANRAEQVAAEIERSGIPALAAPADVTDYRGILQMVARATEAVGAPSIVVNNAGNAGAVVDVEMNTPPFWETEPDNWQPWFEVNAFGVMHCCRAVLPGMIAAGQGGRIINIVSESGRLGLAGRDAYSAAKGAAMAFTRSLARATGKHFITVNALALATVATETASEFLGTEEFREKRLKNFVIPRVGQPHDVAAMTTFLASSAASWITGQSIPVNGGFSFAQ